MANEEQLSILKQGVEAQNVAERRACVFTLISVGQASTILTTTSVHNKKRPPHRRSSSLFANHLFRLLDIRQALMPEIRVVERGVMSAVFLLEIMPVTPAGITPQ